MPGHRALGALSAGAALIHFLVTPEHFREDVLFGGFFLLAATFQLVWGLAILQRESRSLYRTAAIGNAAVVAIWALSRTAGLPVGPNAGVPEPVAAIDALATVYETLIVAGCLYLMTGASERGQRVRRITAPWSVSAVVAFVLPVLAFLTSGHRESLEGGTGFHSHLLAHHLFHVIFIGGAALVFCAYVAVLVMHEGWPTFSWRLDPNHGD